MFTEKPMRSLLAIILVVSVLMTLTGCVVRVDSDEYMTREQVDALLKQSMIGNVTVEGGDNYNVNIDGAENANMLAAAKGVLSAVSITCYFEYKTGYGPSYSSQKTENRKGAGVIYKLDKEQGDAYIITNYHVVYEESANTEGHISKRIYAELYGMENCGMEISCEYVGGSMLYDLAVLKVDGSRIIAESNAVAASVGDSGEVSVLDTAIAIGNPEGDGISATVGYVNVDSEYIDLVGVDNKTKITLRVMTIDTAVNHGNSGGGLFNDRGELIGIVNAKTVDSSVENIGYALPSSLVRAVVENILYYCDGTDTTSVRRALVSINLDVEKYYTVYDTETGRVHKKEIVRIASVTPGGAAEMRLLSGDIIRAVVIDGVRFEADRMHKVTECMLYARVGSSVVFEITRAGVEMNVTIPVSEAMLTDW